MIIEIAKISKDGSTFQGEVDAGKLDLGRDDIIHPNGGLAYEMRVELIGSEILVRGRTWLDAECNCVRCGEIFSTTYEDSSFLRAYECKPEVFDLDLSDDLRESILLVLPPHPVCRDDCKGLCSGCRINLNQDSCTCEKETGDLCWSELKNLNLSE